MLSDTRSVGALLWRNAVPREFEREFSITGHSIIGSRSPHRKLIVPRWVFDSFGRSAKLNQGNHSLLIENGEWPPLTEVGEILHFPIRSEAQFTRKVVSTYLAQSKLTVAPHIQHMIRLIADGAVDQSSIVGLAMNYGAEDASSTPMTLKALADAGMPQVKANVAIAADEKEWLEEIRAAETKISTRIDDIGEITLTIGTEKYALDHESQVQGAPLGTFYTDAFYAGQSDGSLRSARGILRGLFSIISVSTTLDVGCGVGPWSRAALDLGAAKSIGVDGEYVDRASLMIDQSEFRSRNLENAWQLDSGDLSKFDLVISLEVAEHLPSSSAETFISNLTFYGDAVLFSAAIPRQGGVNHINEQWPEYWSEIFARFGYDCFDIVRMDTWRDESIEWWYSQNTFVYARRGSTVHSQLSEVSRPVKTPTSLVHPKKLADAYYWAGKDAQAAADRIALLESDIRARDGLLQHSAEMLVAANKREEELRRSTSWRLTAPLRALSIAIKKARNR
ncbi:hypothetical protein AWB82_06287 [Caballeronia glebae]|uniref:Uncharacterized protein n=1 Tax=Caballeronia glebae TaxID=1777143 RepID=A0A158D4U7_9BURK|nr:class I SAM-dependent methyltransferase [Caballeronia glebae]SAK89672.1 hypothetical protein AWB82_06287 [Caballeronia glebae]